MSSPIPTIRPFPPSLFALQLSCPSFDHAPEIRPLCSAPLRSTALPPPSRSSPSPNLLAAYHFAAQREPYHVVSVYTILFPLLIMNDPICPPFALVRLPLASSSASWAITPTLLSLSRPHSSLCVVWSYCRPPPTSQLYLIHPRRLLLLVHPAGVERLPPPPNRHIALPYLTTQHLFPSTSPDYQRPLPSLCPGASPCLLDPRRPPADSPVPRYP